LELVAAELAGAAAARRAVAGARMKVAGLMGFVAATLAVMSLLHLTGVIGDGRTPFDPDRAGIAEAVIAVVLAAGAIALLRGLRWAARAALVFAIAGFGIGLSMTIRGHAAWDIAYHAAVLPLLLVALVQLGFLSRASMSTN
jgi:hypothetical protein